MTCHKCTRCAHHSQLSVSMSLESGNASTGGGRGLAEAMAHRNEIEAIFASCWAFAGRKFVFSFTFLFCSVQYSVISSSGFLR